jgi:hypothetical protein
VEKKPELNRSHDTTAVDELSAFNSLIDLILSVPNDDIQAQLKALKKPRKALAMKVPAPDEFGNQSAT